METINILKKQAGSKTLKKVLESLLVDIDNGLTLSKSLGKFNHVFGNFFISIIRIGEETGTLAQNLLYLSKEMKKAQEVQGKVRSALIYPSVIFLATIGITALLTFSIFPKVLPIFSSLKINLPITTKLLIVIFNFLLHWGWLVLLAAIALGVLFKASLRWKKIKFTVDRVVARLPVVSSFEVGVTMANLTRTLAVLLKSGVKIIEAVNITADTISNLEYKKVLAEASENISRGESITVTMVKNKKLFPPLVTNLAQIGEQTGTLEENLEYMSEYYEEQVDVLVKNLTSLLEPLLLLVMGVIVGFVALSIITPIYEVTSGIHP